MDCNGGDDNCFCVSMNSNTTENWAFAIKQLDREYLLSIRDNEFETYFSECEKTNFSPEFVKQNKLSVKIKDIPNKEILNKLKQHAFWDEYDKRCISCGACSYQCPFGAIMDKSYITNVIDFILKSQNNTKYKVYAVVAPSISSQFRYAKLGQVIAGLKQLGFYSVIEVALGADMVAYEEAKELAQKGFLTSSCCPAFVDYIEKKFPNLKQHISHNLSPMGAIAKYIKETDPTSKVVFIGPCTAKKMEFKKDKLKGIVDTVMTFEELQALIDSKDIDLTTLEEDVLDNASYYGRIFARSGGLSEAVKQSLKEQNIEFEVKPEVCNGIEACKVALMKKGKDLLPSNFIEGMACVGGCIGGAGNITHGVTNAAEVDKYGKQALEKTILDAISVTNINK